MKKQFKASCPMDCTDLCRFLVTVDSQKVVKLEGDPGHPVTKGFICKKGRALLSRMYHPERLIHPLIKKLTKKGNKFIKISYDEVFEIIEKQLLSIKKEYGTKAILNYTSDGYGGIKNRIQNIFFNCFGGVTQPEGSLCWGAGIAAQQYDFGSPKGHFPDDVLNAQTIFIWGRNPKYTSIHLYKLLKQAQKKGSDVIVIDPIETATARAFDKYVRINPSTDAALALAMANIIIENNLHDIGFIEKNVIGFKRFKAYASSFTLKKSEQITGIDKKSIKTMALQYAKAKRASIYIGFGMQRYHNGGNTIRCIDALGAITGKIGKKGCGVNYAAKSISPYLNDLYKKSRIHALNKRCFTVGNLGKFLKTVQDPPVKAIFVAGANPLTQGPDIKHTRKNFAAVKFKVVFDHFMTDTAQQADIVLPAASVFEQDDLFSTSMYSPVLNYSQKSVDPPEDVIPEFEFYLKLAQKLGMKNLGFKTSKEYLEKSIEPLLQKLGKESVLLDDHITEEYLRIKQNDIPWKDRVFDTPSGKIELYSEKALQDGLSPLPAFIAPSRADEMYPLRLLTCHTIDSMHSQGFAFNNNKPVVYLNRKTAQKFNLQDKSLVYVKGINSKIEAYLYIDEAICDNTAFIYQGFWHKSGAVNFLTQSITSDMGKQAAYYDSFVTLEKTD
ncbi:MAG: molybdopterin-dependent oxidoreductase [Deltaproteobacteria bacterium]|jgi:anaerobic selenocysteine-containing dehydrogenase|nr:molybdopterin-dependent oxidoreductase [Deltaproteobacteria bacterium]